LHATSLRTANQQKIKPKTPYKERRGASPQQFFHSMKTTKFLTAVALAGLIAVFATSGCGKSSSAQSAAAEGDTLVLNLYDVSCVNWEKDTVPSDYPACQGGYWNRTYDSTAVSLCFGSFIFSHSANENYQSWGGFTLGTNGNKFNYIVDCKVPPCWADTTHTASKGWICNQWGVMAGGGITSTTTTPPTVTKPAPYLIAYWDYYDADFNVDLNSQSTNVRLAGDTLFKPIEVYICNHPWPYYGNIQGDGFAQPLTNFGNGASFDLIIHGIKADGVTETTKSVILAEVVGSSLEQDSTWQWVDLIDLGDSIQYLYFTMQSPIRSQVTDQILLCISIWTS
jgi:hypothetical protein